MNPTEDGVKREELDYRAGYVEALAALLLQLQIAGARCTKKEGPGLELAYQKAQALRSAMIEKMKGGAK